MGSAAADEESSRTAPLDVDSHSHQDNGKKQGLNVDKDEIVTDNTLNVDVRGLGPDLSEVPKTGFTSEPNPKDTSSIFSQFTWSWITPLVAKGTQRPLEFEDSWLIHEDDDAVKVVAALKQAWEWQKTKCIPANRKPQLYLPLFKTFWHDIVKAGIIGLLESGVRIGSAVFTGLLTTYFDEDTDTTLAQALGYATGLALCSATFLYTHHFLFFATMRIGMRMRTATMGLVMEKTLELNHEAMAMTTTGHLVNMMSNDVTRFDQLCPFFNFLWIAPIEFAVISYLAYREVGYSVFTGIALLLLLIPFQVISSRLFVYLRSKATILTDERVKKMSEVLMGVRVMKMYAWEESFARVVQSLRSQEMTHVRKAAVMRGFNYAMFFASPSIITCAIFVTYHFTGNQLTSKKVFTVLSLLSVLALTLTLFVPFAVQGCAEVRVSLQRIERHLLQQNRANGNGANTHSLDESLASDANLVSNAQLAEPKKESAGGDVGVLNVGTGQLSRNTGVYIKNLHAVWRLDENDAHAKATMARIARRKKRKETRAQKGEGNTRRALGGRLSGRLSSMHSSFKRSVDKLNKSSTFSVDSSGKLSDLEPDATEVKASQVVQDRLSTDAAQGATQMTTSVDEVLVERSGEENVLTVRALRDISVTVGPKSLLAIVGPVGAGKSTLLLTLLGELSADKGSSTVQGTVSYTSQEAWISGGSVRDNILFGLPYDEQRYAEVVRCCSLATDFIQFPDGDDSELGERGINLSGGQRARISLARCVYRPADVYLLDDPLSAVDAKVGRVLFEDCVNGFLKDKTRVLVTHQLQFLNRCDSILVLEDGRQIGLGSYDELLDKGFDFSVLLQKDEDEDEEQISKTKAKAPMAGLEERDDEDDYGKHVSMKSSRSARSRQDRSESVKSALSAISPTVNATADHNSIISIDDYDAEKASQATRKPRFQLVKREDKQTGTVGSSIYLKYVRAAHSTVLVFFSTIAFMAAQVMLLLANWFLALWADPENEWNTSDDSPWIYGVLVAVLFVFSVIRVMMFLTVLLRSNVALHGSMFKSVLMSPVSFYDSNPAGRILNRFSKDIGTMDDTLPYTAYDTLQASFMIVGILIMVVIILPWVLLAIAPLVVMFVLLRRYFLPASRDIKRLEGIARSPIYSNFSSVLQGLSIIRSFGAGEQKLKDFYAQLNTHSRMWFCFLATQRWLGFRLDFLCCVLITVAGYACIPLRDTLGSGIVGLMLSYVLQLQGVFQWAVRQSAEVENLMTSTERVIEYTDLPPEAPAQTDYPLPEGWPQKGKLEFKQLVMRYSPLLPPVLKGIDALILPGQKIGIVGRTGAGKSSILAALFRLTEYETEPLPTGVYIDDVPTHLLGTHTLRSHISVIPQEPVLFSGTIRSNLDPFNEHSDEVLFKALADVQLKDLTESMGNGLYSVVTEDGGNLSIGQKQLFCLCRAILSHNKILIMDEATANVDNKTDQLISSTLRQLFTDCTILTIAHRLNTIMDSDKVLVLDQGTVLEFDSPSNLLAQADSSFRHLYDEMERAHAHDAE